jgi:hypothetical protein
MMASEEPGRLLIYPYAEGFGRIGETDLIKLTASMQRRFPAHPVEPADPPWLRETVKEPLPSRGDFKARTIGT